MWHRDFKVSLVIRPPWGRCIGITGRSPFPSFRVRLMIPGVTSLGSVAFGRLQRRFSHFRPFRGRALRLLCIGRSRPYNGPARPASHLSAQVYGIPALCRTCYACVSSASRPAELDSSLPLWGKRHLRRGGLLRLSKIDWLLIRSRKAEGAYRSSGTSASRVRGTRR